MEDGESSAAIRARVEGARRIQAERFRNHERIHSNAQMSTRLVRVHCELDAPGRRLMKEALARLGLSARAYARILKVARTIADLANAPDVRPEYVAEAIQYRSLDRRSLV